MQSALQGGELLILGSMRAVWMARILQEDLYVQFLDGPHTSVIPVFTYLAIWWLPLFLDYASCVTNSIGFLLLWVLEHLDHCLVKHILSCSVHGNVLTLPWIIWDHAVMNFAHSQPTSCFSSSWLLHTVVPRASLTSSHVFYFACEVLFKDMLCFACKVFFNESGCF